jgi:hypothetical protein
MPSFPFTFSFAGRTFSVVTDRADAADAEAEVRGPGSVYVRVIGIRGLHDLGPVHTGETSERLRARVCQWYADTYGPDTLRAASAPGAIALRSV